MKTIQGLTASAFAGLFLMLPARSDAVVVIDTFTTPQSASIVIGDRNTADGPGIIGGERDMATIFSMSANGTVPNQLHLLTLGFGAGGDIYYDGNDNDPSTTPFNGMGAIDLTEGGVNDRLQIDFTATSNVPATLAINVINVGVSAGYQLNLPLSPGIVEIQFASFAGSAAAFQNAGAIILHFEIHGEGSFTIDSILATVPEPATIPLMLTAAVGLGFNLRRIRSASF